MAPAAPPPFAHLRPHAARAVLGLYAAVTLAFVAVTFSAARSGYADTSHRRPSDVWLYRAEIERIAAGENYYEAAAAELRHRGYPTRSIFNWRTPLPMWFLGQLPDPTWGKALLATVALATLLLSVGAVLQEGTIPQALGCLLLLSGALLPCFVGDLYVMPVVWASAFIAFSLVALAAGRIRLGVAAGIAALFLRELALGYCVVMAALAVGRKRPREAAAWSIGIAAWGLFFAWHASQVAAWSTPHDHAHRESWVQLLGAPFLISTAQMNCYLMLLPQWVAAIYLPLAVLGLAASRSPWGERVGLAVCAYLVAFAFVGQAFNQYWGMLYAPLLCFGAVRGPAALRGLLRAASLTPCTAAARQPA